MWIGWITGHFFFIREFNNRISCGLKLQQATIAAVPSTRWQQLQQSIANKATTLANFVQNLAMLPNSAGGAILSVLGEAGPTFHLKWRAFCKVQVHRFPFMQLQFSSIYLFGDICHCLLMKRIIISVSGIKNVFNHF